MNSIAPSCITASPVVKTWYMLIWIGSRQGISYQTRLAPVLKGASTHSAIIVSDVVWSIEALITIGAMEAYPLLNGYVLDSPGFLQSQLAAVISVVRLSSVVVLDVPPYEQGLGGGLKAADNSHTFVKRIPATRVVTLGGVFDLLGITNLNQYLHYIHNFLAS